MAYFEPRIYRAVNAGPLRFDIMKFCCIRQYVSCMQILRLVCFVLEGEVVNYEHAIPRGGWFEYVSCPHFFMEIVIYFAFVVVGGFFHKTLFSVFVFVLSNQLVAGHLTHCWYKQQFKSYPPKRRAILPYLF